MADENSATVLQDGQLAVATVAQTGEIVSNPSEIDTTAVVQTESGKQLCVKTVSVGGGGGGGGTVDQTYDPTSTNAQSGTAVAEAVAPALKNTATGGYSVSIAGTGTTTYYAVNVGVLSNVSTQGVAIGYDSKTLNNGAIAVGMSAKANYNYSIAIGRGTKANANNAIQIGSNGSLETVNTSEKTLQVFEHQLLDGNTGKIPSARFPTKNAYFNFEDINSYIISANECPSSYSSLDITVKCTGAINKKNPNNNQIFIGTPDDSFCFFSRHNTDHKFSVWTGSETIGTTALQEYQTTFWLKLIADGAGAGNLYYLPDNNYTLATLPAITSWTNECSFTGASVASKKLTVSQPSQHCAYNTTFYEAKVVVDNTTVLDLQDASTFQVYGAVRKTQWFE